MLKTKMMALLLALALMLTGCQSIGEIENQAYALVLGVDRTEDGGIELTMRIPRIGHAEASGDGGEHLVLAASGGDYPQALERLQWAAARELNLSHIFEIVVSEALASGDGFPTLIRQIAETRHLYTTAAFIVCEGRARDFIEGQETILGVHLSNEITAMFRHYAAHGYIPRSTFAELYYATCSVYSDPTAIWGFMDPGEQSEPAAAVITEAEDRLNADTLTASSRQYLGAALFSDGKMVGRLDAGETLCLDLLTGKVDAFSYATGGKTYVLSTSRGSRRSVTLDGDAVTLHATVCLNAENTVSQTEQSQVEAALRADLQALIHRCQALGTEPFGFAERAAVHFVTLEQWRRFDWRQRFAGAAVDIEVKLQEND